MARIIQALALLLLYTNITGAQTLPNKKTGLSVRQHLLVYKTTGDYYDRVPVILSADKEKIVSYPDVADIKAQGGNTLPVRLNKGYLLSRYGISDNTAFLNLTYQQYAALPSTPTPGELYKMIQHKSPVKELCDCGAAGQGGPTANELKALIDEGTLRKKCKVIK